MKAETKHTPGAVKVAKIILNGKRLISTAYGKKTGEGIADLIDRETAALDLLEACKSARQFVRGKHSAFSIAAQSIRPRPRQSSRGWTVKQKPKETRSYICNARWEYRGEVIIEASSPEEAAEKFEKLQDTEFLDSAAEMDNWELTGKIRLNA